MPLLESHHFDDVMIESSIVGKSGQNDFRSNKNARNCSSTLRRERSQGAGLGSKSSPKKVHHKSAPFLKTDMVQACAQGWTISMGWHKRPKAVQINESIITRDIQKWAARLRPEDYEDPDEESPETTQVPEEITFKEQNAKSLSLARLSLSKPGSPGPKYNLREGDDTKDASAANQRFNTRSKDIKLCGSGRDSYLRKNFSPGPIYKSELGDVGMNLRRSGPRIDAMVMTGRLLHGSIYEGKIGSGVPGPCAYRTEDAYVHESRVMPSQGSFFAPPSPDRRHR